MYALRGATTVDSNTEEEISLRSLEMVDQIIEKNNLKTEDIIAMIFIATEDIDAAYPSKFVRKLRNMPSVSFMNVQEMKVVNSLEKCIRVTIFVNGNSDSKEDVYLRGAKDLKLK